MNTAYHGAALLNLTDNQKFLSLNFKAKCLYCVDNKIIFLPDFHLPGGQEIEGQHWSSAFSTTQFFPTGLIKGQTLEKKVFNEVNNNKYKILT